MRLPDRPRAGASDAGPRAASRPDLRPAFRPDLRPESRPDPRAASRPDLRAASSPDSATSFDSAVSAISPDSAPSPERGQITADLAARLLRLPPGHPSAPVNWATLDEPGRYGRSLAEPTDRRGACGQPSRGERAEADRDELGWWQSVDGGHSPDERSAEDAGWADFARDDAGLKGYQTGDAGLEQSATPDLGVEEPATGDAGVGEPGADNAPQLVSGPSSPIWSSAALGARPDTAAGLSPYRPWFAGGSSPGPWFAAGPSGLLSPDALPTGPDG
jgi:hypothetical protein